MLVAMLHATADRGYVAATVADVVARASVSRSTFYGHFADKEACFVAAYEFAMDHVIEEMQIANRSLPDDGWRSRLHSDLTTYLNALAADPVLATNLHVEVLAAGHEALEHRAELLGMLAIRIAHLNDVARSEEPDLPEIPPAAFALYTGGLDELIRDRLRVGTPDDLRDLAQPVFDATSALFGAPPPPGPAHAPLGEAGRAAAGSSE
jgi:AcrR family transcriptional regulator